MSKTLGDILHESAKRNADTLAERFRRRRVVREIREKLDREKYEKVTLEMRAQGFEPIPFLQWRAARRAEIKVQAREKVAREIREIDRRISLERRRARNRP